MCARRENKEDFEPYLGEDFTQYTAKMEQSGTWGDELTLVGPPPCSACKPEISAEYGWRLENEIPHQGDTSVFRDPAESHLRRVRCHH